MNNRKYEPVVQELIAANVFPHQGNYFDFNNDPLKSEFQKLFDFAQELLDRKDLEYEFPQGRFFYNNQPQINAFAYSENGYSIIEMFSGGVRRVYELFDEANILFDRDDLKKYKPLAGMFQITPGYFLFNYVMLYFVYHEAGHLVQRLQGSINYEENLQGGLVPENVKERHIREYDADWFAASHLGPKLVQAANGGQHLEGLTELALAGIYIYFIKHAESLPEIYYEEEAHPHPSVRLSYIIIHLLEAIAVNTEDPLDDKKILKEVIRISEQLLITPKINIIEKYSKQLYKEISKVEAYIQTIRDNSNTYPYLSRKAFNL
jgi:hypothetical protein